MCLWLMQMAHYQSTWSKHGALEPEWVTLISPAAKSLN